MGSGDRWAGFRHGGLFPTPLANTLPPHPPPWLANQARGLGGGLLATQVKFSPRKSASFLLSRPPRFILPLILFSHVSLGISRALCVGELTEFYHPSSSPPSLVKQHVTGHKGCCLRARRNSCKTMSRRRADGRRCGCGLVCVYVLVCVSAWTLYLYINHKMKEKTERERE